ncbi:MAG: zraS 6 [Chthoniobacteraceae bacterium]|nr:zraS 6 [Chthoniobacteraceae bacterium]
MNLFLSFAASFFSAVLAFAVLVREKRTFASCCFAVGMGALSIESALECIRLNALTPREMATWQWAVFVVKSFMPGLWLTFGLSYSRGNYREFLVKWRFLLAATFILPIGITLGFREELIRGAVAIARGTALPAGVGRITQLLNLLLLIGNLLVLMNLEETFRSAIGTMRWRIKFVVLGVGVIFGARIFMRSQALLFSGQNRALTEVEIAALLLGCALMAVAYLRSGFAEIDIYPSRAVLHSSVIALLVGGYLLGIGMLAQVIAHFGGTRNFQAKAFFVLTGIVALAVVLLSDRFRLKIQFFVSRHFRLPQHDSRKIWTLLTHSMSGARDQASLAVASAKLISETFNILSVTVWLVDEQNRRLVFGGSTVQCQKEADEMNLEFAPPEPLPRGLGGLSLFDLEKHQGAWAETLRQISSTPFRKAGNRICIPFLAGERWLGMAILADRAHGLPYTLEELDLLKCIGDQVAASLLSLQLTEELMLGKEMEAFRTMSAFFVHDLKNATSSLGLMLQNLPVHFNDPAFRADALRGIANTVSRINHLIERLSALRNKFELKAARFDLNELVNEALEGLNQTPEIEITKELGPLSNVNADREQLQSVLTNILLNARDAVGKSGRIIVQTSQREGRAVLSVADTGCGMSAPFVRESLFRPFHTTKKKGLGIGMFHSKMIVEAHRGHIQVESEPGKGTTFRVSLPLEMPL